MEKFLRADNVLALVGRTNVGKSTLFNALVKKRRKVLVAPVEGVTRDVLRDKMPDLLGWEVLDTPGWNKKEHFFEIMRKRYLEILQQSSQIAMVLDSQMPLSENDEELIQWMREANLPFVCLVNKVDAPTTALHPSVEKFISKNHYFCISALHKTGLQAFYDHLQSLLPMPKVEDQCIKVNACHIVLVGRPNAGKSTLFNALVGENMALVSDIPGTTRDTVWKLYEDKAGKKICLFDTAGIRRRTRVNEDLEKMSVSAARDALRFAHIACLLVDATMPLERQDLRIMSDLCKNGRCVILIVNKIDLVRDPKLLMKQINNFFLRHFTDLLKPIVLPVSAKKSLGVRKILPAIHYAYKAWDKRVGTSLLNNKLADWLSELAPPRVGGRTVKVRFITQVNKRPPTFLLSVSNTKGMTDAYLRYLRNKIQKEFGFEEVPVRMMVRSSKRERS